MVVANTSNTTSFNGHVLIDRVINYPVAHFKVFLDNLGSPGTLTPVTKTASAIFWEGAERRGSAAAASIAVSLQPMEFQVLAADRP